MNAPEHPYAGKGIFATWIGAAPPRRKPADPDVVGRRAAAAGIEWIAGLVTWRELRGSKMATRSIVGTLGNAARVLATHGIRLIPWAYVVPGADHAEEAARLLEENAAACVSAWPCPWYEQAPAILDLEWEWNGRSDAEVDELADALEARGLEGCVSSYGAPWSFPRLPWAAFAERFAWAMPQAYDGGERSEGPDYPARSVAAYADHFAEGRIVPLSRAYTAQSGAHYDRRELVALAKRTPTPAGGLGWWSLGSMTPGRWAGIGDVEIPGRS